MVTPPGDGCWSKHKGAWRSERGGTTRREGKEKEGAPRGEVTGVGCPGERGKVVVLREGQVLSEVAAWNHPQPCNSYIISINHGPSGD